MTGFRLLTNAELNRFRAEQSLAEHGITKLNALDEAHFARAHASEMRRNGPLRGATDIVTDELRSAIKMASGEPWNGRSGARDDDYQNEQPQGGAKAASQRSGSTWNRPQGQKPSSATPERANNQSGGEGVTGYDAEENDPRIRLINYLSSINRSEQEINDALIAAGFADDPDQPDLDDDEDPEYAETPPQGQRGPQRSLFQGPGKEEVSEDDPPPFPGRPRVGRGPSGNDAAAGRGRWGGRSREATRVTSYPTPAQDAAYMSRCKPMIAAVRAQQALKPLNRQARQIATDKKMMAALAPHEDATSFFTRFPDAAKIGVA